MPWEATACTACTALCVVTWLYGCVGVGADAAATLVVPLSRTSVRTAWHGVFVG